ncbi:MAG TPA: GNAT family N-acyltransferase [Thermoanaerobaculaceae bacterium]|nr:GNAT family N-acyltransferase [Thermoanaerobaculaceae bacterium]HRS16374.1 GNAT family N-acyltransferase [Thermoanaerobaculaceae bacterium]
MPRTNRSELRYTLEPPEGRKLDLAVLWRAPLERLLAVDRLRKVYAPLAGLADPARFCTEGLAALGVGFEVSDADLARIPVSGPAVVVANHPFGGIEGLVLGALLTRRRPDVRIMANFLLEVFEPLRELFIFVDPFGGPRAAAASRAGLREAIRWVEGGGLLAIFPAGEVASLRLRGLRVTDPPWNDTAARIVRRGGAAAVPVFFAGNNGPVFHLAGLLHPRLRTALLVRELLNKRSRTLVVRVGDPISPSRLASLGNEREVTRYLRERTFNLERRGRPSRRRVRAAEAAPVADPQAPEVLEAELDALPPAAWLAESGGLRVAVARATEIPGLLLEIGRLREATFRAAGEGSGKARDLDEFDATYLHLFIWDGERKQVAGAYRLGPTDEILPARGIAGLYTSTLWRFTPELFERMGPALEMGRSFICQEYQRSFAGLMLLWKGIGQYVVRHPRYRVLFGPVSISADYQHASRALIAQFLKANHALSEWAHLARPRRPFRVRRWKAVAGKGQPWATRDVDTVSTFVSDLEADAKGVPILVKQYLRLGGRILSFNVDPEFADVVDGLIVVDLLRTERRTLERYMGVEGAASFLSCHPHGTAAS